MREVPGASLRAEQDELMQQIVEAEHATTQRLPFLAAAAIGTVLTVQRLPDGDVIEAFDGDLIELTRNGFIAYWPDSSNPPLGYFDLTQTGLDYYAMRFGSARDD